jgi:hypothetical protein
MVEAGTDVTLRVTFWGDLTAEDAGIEVGIQEYQAQDIEPWSIRLINASAFGCDDGPSVGETTIDKDAWNLAWQGKTLQLDFLYLGLEYPAPCETGVFIQYEIEFALVVQGWEFVPGTGPATMRFRSFTKVRTPIGSWDYVFADLAHDPTSGAFIVEHASQPPGAAARIFCGGIQASPEPPPQGCPGKGCTESRTRIHYDPWVVRFTSTTGCPKEPIG